MKKNNEKSPPSPIRRKGWQALLCLGAVLLWAVLWLVFPMEFYSLFFASMIGNNVLLVLLSVVLTFPFNFIFSKALGKDIPALPSLIANVICMVAFIYAYSVYWLVKLPWLWLTLALGTHCIASAVIFVMAKPLPIPKVKAEKKPVRSAVLGVLSAVLADGLYLLLFTMLLDIFLPLY